MDVAIVSKALDGAPYCGDQGGYWPDGGRVTMCLADGLGHGKEAQAAARAAVDYVGANRAQPLAGLFQGCDGALRQTRGAAVSVAVADEAARTLTFAAIGNVRGVVVGEKNKRLATSTGIVGGGYKSLAVEEMPLASGNLVILFTDGLRMVEADLPNLTAGAANGVGDLAERLLAAWWTGADDGAVLVSRLGPG